MFMADARRIWCELRRIALQNERGKQLIFISTDAHQSLGFFLLQSMTFMESFPKRSCCLFLIVWALLLLQASSLASRCKMWKDEETIVLKDNPACRPTKVKVGMCSGRCRSYAFPNTKRGQEWKPFVQDCHCCSPKKVKTKEVTLKGCGKVVVVKDIRSCECRKCSLR